MIFSLIGEDESKMAIFQKNLPNSPGLFFRLKVSEKRFSRPHQFGRNINFLIFSIFFSFEKTILGFFSQVYQKSLLFQNLSNSSSTSSCQHFLKGSKRFYEENYRKFVLESNCFLMRFSTCHKEF